MTTTQAVRDLLAWCSQKCQVRGISGNLPKSSQCQVTTIRWLQHWLSEINAPIGLQGVIYAQVGEGCSAFSKSGTLKIFFISPSPRLLKISLRQTWRPKDQSSLALSHPVTQQVYEFLITRVVNIILKAKWQYDTSRQIPLKIRDFYIYWGRVG